MSQILFRQTNKYNCSVQFYKPRYSCRIDTIFELKYVTIEKENISNFSNYQPFLIDSSSRNQVFSIVLRNNREPIKKF